MEEAVGDCTNLHITYPAMVYGFVSVLRANQQDEEIIEDALEELEPEDAPPGKKLKANDIAILKGGEPVEVIIRYHAALRELTGRRGIRDDLSRYETIAVAMVESNIGTPGKVLDHFPPVDSPLRIEEFFQAVYLRYDERYVYAAPDLKKITRRREWSKRSPLFNDPTHAAFLESVGYLPRLAG